MPHPANPTWSNKEHRRLSASYSERRLGFGCGVSAASTRRWRARSPSSCGGRRRQATNCASPHAAQTAAGKAQRSSGQVGPVIMSASIRFRLATRICSLASECVNVTRLRNRGPNSFDSNIRVLCSHIHTGCIVVDWLRNWRCIEAR
jgi:hypothetical protein